VIILFSSQIVWQFLAKLSPGQYDCPKNACISHSVHSLNLMLSAADGLYRFKVSTARMAKSEYADKAIGTAE
jgi:hypothetical protein